MRFESVPYVDSPTFYQPTRTTKECIMKLPPKSVKDIIADYLYKVEKATDPNEKEYYSSLAKYLLEHQEDAERVHSGFARMSKTGADAGQIYKYITGDWPELLRAEVAEQLKWLYNCYTHRKVLPLVDAIITGKHICALNG